MSLLSLSNVLNLLADCLSLSAELDSTFSETVLSVLLSHTGSISSPEAHLATLELLSFRMARLRFLSDPAKISPLPFETFVACHAIFRPALQSFRKSLFLSSLIVELISFLFLF